MKTLRVYGFLLGAAFCLGPIGEAVAQNLFVQDFASSPAASTVSMRSQGRKGLRILMGYSGAGPGFPIDASAASVALTVNGVTHNCNFNVLTPVNDNDCGFAAVRFDNTALHPSADTVEVFFRGDFPAGASITETVSGVRAADLTSQAAPGSVSFTSDSGGVRQTASMELAFDISGSMSLPIAATTDPSAESRINALKDAANPLYALLGSHAVVGDKVGQLFFSTDISTGGASLVPANDPTQLGALKNTLAVQQPTNNTAIGKALLAAQAGLAGDSNTQQYIFLFSDGEQNVQPCVDSMIPSGGPITIGGPGAVTPACGPSASGPATIPTSIKVCTITMGTQTATGYALQDAMSVVSCPGKQHSLFVNASDPTFAMDDLETYFTQEIITALGGDKLEIVKDVNGTVAAASAATETFHGNTLDQTMSIFLSWRQGREIRPQLTLTAPDGTTIDLNGRVTISTNSAFISLHFPLSQGGPAINPKGLWQLGIKSVPGTTAAALIYHLIVVNDNGSINTDASLDIQDAGTGEPIPVTVTLKDGAVNVSGATVSAVLLGPENGLGDILAKATNPSGTPAPTGDLLGSAAQAKLQLLLQDPAFVALLKNDSLPAVALSDSGHPGTYTGTFTGALKEGHYQFLVLINGNTAANGAFERTRKLTVFVRPKADPARTTFTLVSRTLQPGGAVLVQLRATPRDRFGSFLGPDYLPQLSITCTPCTVSTPIADDLHGSYDVTYQLASAAADPTVGLVILGQTVVQSSLSGLSGSGLAFGNGKYAVSFHAGGDFSPSGTLAGVSPSVSFGGDFEYRLHNGLSFETYLGYDRFGSAAGSEHIVNLSERVRYTYGAARLRPFAFFGFGGYFAGGAVQSNAAGINLGAGPQYWFLPHLAGEAAYTFHDDFSLANANARYSTGTLGARWVF